MNLTKSRIKRTEVQVAKKAVNRQKELDKLIKNRANYSLAILGMGFVRNGSGRFLNIRVIK